MTKYILMYFGGKRPESPVEFAAIMESWRNWSAKHGSAVLDGGNPLSQSATITADGVKTGTQTELPTGYSIIEAESMEVAISIAQSTPVVADGGRAIAYETFKVI